MKSRDENNINLVT